MFKKFTHFTWVSLLVLVLSNTAYAQKNYVKGYIILPSQDTLSGLIDDQNWERNPDFIYFKKNIESEKQRFGISQIMGFGAETGNSYRRSVVQVDATPTRVEELLLIAKPKIRTDTVFLQELVKGNVNLYHLSDANHKTHFFIQIKNNAIKELIQRNYLVTKNRQQFLGTYNQYKDQLQYTYLTECASLVPLIKNTTYTKFALTTLIEKYNTCLNPVSEAEFKTALDKHELKFNIVAGANSTRYTFKGERNKYLTDTKFDWQSNPMVGLAFQVLLPQNRQKWSIYNEVTWKKNYTKSKYRLKDGFTDESGTVTIKADYIGLSSLVRYSWMNPNYQPFLNAGITFNRLLNLDTRVQTVAKHSTYNEVKDAPLITDPRNFEVGVVAGAGIKVKKVTAELRLEKGSGFLIYQKLSVDKNMLLFLLSYQIK
ncbi:porin family protein [Adhaeribacter radiodurans]|uniref:PorT family protein n=1 Tax=Adhaeribacter radiodurans TaxID=2745197 RepID=A0A7L7L6X7_9BACT|nr:outer membrane beta-barrel protein [Adhaeribacter radiodurans]QMU28533.1 PorT family protein [Adhaeribacter radiodurans]